MLCIFFMQWSLPSQVYSPTQRENSTVKMVVSDSLHLNSELNEESVTTCRTQFCTNNLKLQGFYYQPLVVTGTNFEMSYLKCLYKPWSYSWLIKLVNLFYFITDIKENTIPVSTAAMRWSLVIVVNQADLFFIFLWSQGQLTALNDLHLFLIWEIYIM